MLQENIARQCGLVQRRQKLEEFHQRHTVRRWSNPKLKTKKKKILLHNHNETTFGNRQEEEEEKTKTKTNRLAER